MIRLGVLSLAAAALAGPAFTASLDLRDVPGKVVVLPENRSDIAVTLLRMDSRYPVSVSTFGGHTIVAGRPHGGWSWWLGPHVGFCGDPGWLGAMAPFGGQPEILVRTPLDVKVDASGDSGGVIARARSVDLTLDGCGDWIVGDVAERLAIEDAGSSDVRTGAIGDLELRIQGSGDVATQAVASGLDAAIGGSGDLFDASASGPVKLRVYGSGDINIKGGHTPHLDLAVYGSGNVDYRGTADHLDALVSGSGDVKVAKVTGRVNKSTTGSGDIDVGR